MPVSRPARRSLALRPTWSLSRPGRPVAPECFSRSRYLLQPLRLLPAGATVAGRVSNPLREKRLSTAHRIIRAMHVVGATIPPYKRGWSCSATSASLQARNPRDPLRRDQPKPCGHVDSRFAPDRFPVGPTTTTEAVNSDCARQEEDLEQNTSTAGCWSNGSGGNDVGSKNTRANTSTSRCIVKSRAAPRVNFLSNFEEAKGGKAFHLPPLLNNN